MKPNKRSRQHCADSPSQDLPFTNLNTLTFRSRSTAPTNKFLGNKMSPHLYNALQISNKVLNRASSISPFLLPFLQTQRRAASVLSNLSDNSGAYHKNIRRGRGPSSGKGKTAGRGYGGQKAHGKVPRGFNGGQTKLEVVHGVRGFVNVYVQWRLKEQFIQEAN